jgi:hypothetical protein
MPGSVVIAANRGLRMLGRMAAVCGTAREWATEGLLRMPSSISEQSAVFDAIFLGVLKLQQTCQKNPYNIGINNDSLRHHGAGVVV